MARRMLMTGVFYFMVSVGIGMYMSIAQNYMLKPVHVHLNMIGWVSLAIGGLIYLHFPKTTTSIWGKIHYWTHMIGVPAMMFGMAIVIVTGVESVVMIAAQIGALLIALGTVSFFVNVMLHVKM